MFWKEIPIHVMDFEGSNASGIVEFGVVTLLNGGVYDTRTRLCKPLENISEIEFAQHGIREDEARQYEYFSAEWDYFCQLKRKGVLCAHYASVENSFIRRVWPYPAGSSQLASVEWGPWVDSYRLYKNIYPALGSYKLGDLVAQFELQDKLNEMAALYCPKNRQVFHCALYDALASALLLLRLGKEPGFEDMSIPWLVRHSAIGSDEPEQLQLSF